ncbi:DUF1801 domain-containing protein [Flavobacterium sp.]|jgi:uncharacterized protein YdhG (YjbR/CyaY superfamily)|uniref:DUF1801 domain-containing protein n=1 Tax=Flavobacterium sp. TaxID=239 RepID=UPI0037C19A75
MTSKATSVDQYINEVPEDRRTALQQLRAIILKNLPEGFQEEISYCMIGYVVPHSIYPKGYHCSPELPLPFMSFASQKNSINFYHMGIYAKPELYNWFVAEYPKHSKQKLDIGKSCFRIKKPENIPFELIGELARKMSVAEWIKTYEVAFNK